MKIIKDIAALLGYSIYNTKYHNKKFRFHNEFKPLEQIFYRKYHNDFFFIQIGANNGIRFDPIYELVTKNKTKGIVVEPIKDYYLELKNNYQKFPGILPLNKAIHATEKKIKMYRVNNSKGKYPDAALGIASLDPEHHKKTGIDSKDIVEETVEAVSLHELLTQYKVKHIDLLQIDAEGYDYEILSMLDLDVIQPGIISFEHSVLDGVMTHEQLFEIQERLVRKGYDFMIFLRDVIAYRR